jgi:hypothetical protein
MQQTILFIVGFALIRGSEKDYIQDDVAEQFLPMFLANCKVWPAINVVSFTLVPLEHRMLFSQMVNLVWGVYLSCEFYLFFSFASSFPPRLFDSSGGRGESLKMGWEV